MEQSVTKTAIVESVDENEMADWLLSSKPGEVIEYHRGNLAYFRSKSADLDLAAQRVYAAYEDGFVTLVQRRVEPDVMAYIAIRKPGHYVPRCAA